MPVRDDGESTGIFEPLLVSESSKSRSKLADLALELATRSEGFRRSLPVSIAAALANLVRSMNSDVHCIVKSAAFGVPLFSSFGVVLYEAAP